MLLVLFQREGGHNLWIIQDKGYRAHVIPLTVGAVLLSPAVMWKEHVDMLLVDRLACWIADMSNWTLEQTLSSIMWSLDVRGDKMSTDHY